MSKCISLWQPWCSAWLSPLKTFETRHWYTSYRGPLLIHAAKKRDGAVHLAFQDDELLDDLMSVDLIGLHYGAIIGQVNLIGCSLMSRMPQPSEREARWGDWHPERYAWERGPEYIVFPKPIPFKGSQGFFEVPEELVGAGAV